MRLFIFDMDGTVVDSMPALRQLGIDTLTLYTNLTKEEAEAHYDTTVGIPFKDQLELIPPKLRLKTEIDMVASLYEVEHLSMSLADFQMTSRAKEHLSYLRAKMQRSVALVTSSSPEILANIMAKSGAYNCWDFLSGTENGKGKFDQILNLVTKLRIPWHDVIYFGDSKTDANLACELGCHFRHTTVADFEGEGLYDELGSL